MSSEKLVKEPQSESISHWGMHSDEFKGIPQSYKKALDPSHPFYYKQETTVTYSPIEPRAKEGTLLYRQLNSKAFATQVGGSHYKKHAIQPTEYAMANALDTCQANVVKYITRFRDKGGAKDLRKVMHYVEFLLETEYPGE